MPLLHQQLRFSYRALRHEADRATRELEARKRALQFDDPNV
jgi:hypothetical protein